MIPQPLTIDSFTAGDHFPSVGPITITVGGSTPDHPLATVIMRFKQGATVVELSSADAQITISDAAAWTFSVPRQAVPALTAGVWVWKGKCIDSQGVLDTYLADTITILPDV